MHFGTIKCKKKFPAPANVAAENAALLAAALVVLEAVAMREVIRLIIFPFFLQVVPNSSFMSKLLLFVLNFYRCSIVLFS